MKFYYIMDEENIISQIIEKYQNDPNIYIKDEEGFKLKLKKLIHEGKKSIQVVSDFDMTVTKYWKDGKRSPTSHGIIARSPLYSEEAIKRSLDIVNKYYPYEINTEISHEEKYKYMVEWWTKQQNHIISQNITPELLDKMITIVPVSFRDGFFELFELCKSNEIPILIPSAGIQNVIEGIFRLNNLKYEKLYIKANEMIFSPETNKCVAFKKPIIHSLNKYQFDFKGTPYEKYIVDRKNILLFGDSTGDVNMSETIEHEQVLSFGFLNINFEKSIEKFKDIYDVVIANDSSFNFANDIIKLL